ncbi:MAG: hypothetical protein NWR89_06435 [Schleiferiaceae bacterium]|jgi:hypothetical protein|nr:hypothetical protein [Schleiferiaceae bacterium]MDP4774427.1 hypothetical protein [Schleiferiaceae bacterium]
MFLKELEDYSWFPPVLRKMQLEYVGWISASLAVYRPLGTIMEGFPSNQWTDLASGSGWPALYLKNKATNPIFFRLTDWYPHSASEEVLKHMEYDTQPLNLLNFQPEAGQQYSMFNAFHHFTTQEQKQIITKMKEAKAGFIIAEVLEPSLLSFIQVTLAALLVQPLSAWAIRPFSFLRIATTYLVPIQLATVAWDGWLSVLKSKTLAQYQDLVRGVSSSEYVIQVERIPQLRGNLIVLSAQPILS